jgi:hypothetical protein
MGAIGARTARETTLSAVRMMGLRTPRGRTCRATAMLAPAGCVAVTSGRRSRNGLWQTSTMPVTAAEGKLGDGNRRQDAGPTA